MKKLILMFLLVMAFAFCGCKNHEELPTIKYENSIEEEQHDTESRDCFTVILLTDEHNNILAKHEINTPKGVKITYIAEEIDGYEFIGWQLGDNNLELHITVNDSRMYAGVYRKIASRTTMYTTTALNVRTSPEIVNGNIVKTVPVNTELVVLDYNEEQYWNEIEWQGARYHFVATEYLSEEKTVVKNNFCYYGVYTGAWWHFTPEEIDNAWLYYVNGKEYHRSGKPFMETGTTRAWQKYLYSKLEEKGITWWYKYAVAQALQESGFNPLNTESIDHGLFSFRIWYWNSAYGDICDYHANINAYIDRISPYLIGATPYDEEVINRALRQHYNSGNQKADDKYVQDVKSRLPELWKQ